MYCIGYGAQKMKSFSILFALFFCFNNIFCMQDRCGVLSPSIVGEVYAKLSREHLVGRMLASSDIKKAKKMIDVNQLEHWTQQIKPFELDLLFQLGIVLDEIGHRDLAADMILFSYANGNKNNFVIESIGDEVVTKERIMKVLDDMGL